MKVMFSELTSCSLRNLSGLFKYSRHLKRLHLNNNELSSLVVDDFANLANLEDLNLSYNKLTQLPLGIFDKLLKLKSMFLDCNPLIALPEKMFQKNPSVSSFRISGNACYNRIEILNLTSRMFYSHHLRSISIRNIKIDSFSPDWLEACSGTKLIGDLVVLIQSICWSFPIYFQFYSCQQNDKWTIQTVSFSGLVSLTLTECNIRTFSAKILNHSPNVGSLSLSHNGLRHLVLDGLNLPRLENLDVKFNRLDDSFFLNTIRGLKFYQLKTFNISHNRVTNLSHIADLLPLMPSVEHIDLRKMSQIPLKDKIFNVLF